MINKKEQTMSEFFLGFQPSITERGRMKVEFSLSNGTKYLFTTRQETKTKAIQEILQIVEILQDETGGNVLWRIAGTKNYHMNCHYRGKVPLSYKIKKGIEMFKDYFFDYEYESEIELEETFKRGK